jgi:hypothetical protein
VNSNSLGLSLTLVELVNAIGSNWGGDLLVAAGSWGIGIVVGVVGIGSSNIGSGSIRENRWLSLSFTLSQVVSSITVGPRVAISVVVEAISIVAIVVIAIGWVAIAIGSLGLSFRFSCNSCGKAEKGNLKC